MAERCRHRRTGDGPPADPSICVWRCASARAHDANLPCAVSIRVALNRSDDVKTDQEILSPSAVHLLTVETISVFGANSLTFVRDGQAAAGV
jgi:hypothetical protein